MTLPQPARVRRWRSPLGRLLGVLAGAIGVIWAAATLSFLMMRLVPGDPVSVMLGPQAQVSEETKDAIRADLGLDRPWFTQYLDTLGGLLRGDLGQSYQLRKPVVEVIAGQLPSTMQLAGAALVIALVLVTVVTIAARRPTARRIAAVIEQAILSTPVFWIGLLLSVVFAFGLHWFPVSGSRGAASLVLPAVTLALPTAALLGQVLRDGIEQAERRTFAETVIARGATSRRLLLHHTLRHGAIGAVPLAAYLVGSLFGGAVLVETVFARPGLGRITLSAIVDRDLPVIGGVIILSALVFSLVAVLADLVVPLLDPRQRRASGARA